MFHKLRCLLRQLSVAGAMLATFGATGALAGGPKAYVGNFKDNTVSVIDIDAGAVVATLPVRLAGSLNAPSRSWLSRIVVVVKKPFEATTLPGVPFGIAWLATSTVTGAPPALRLWRYWFR